MKRTGRESRPTPLKAIAGGLQRSLEDPFARRKRRIKEGHARLAVLSLATADPKLGRAALTLFGALIWAYQIGRPLNMKNVDFLAVARRIPKRTRRFVMDQLRAAGYVTFRRDAGTFHGGYLNIPELEARVNDKAHSPVKIKGQLELPLEVPETAEPALAKYLQKRKRSA